MGRDRELDGDGVDGPGRDATVADVPHPHATHGAPHAARGASGRRTAATSPTLAEIARAAGVSRMTASRAINGREGVSPALRERIVRIADEMGYVANWVARKLTASRDGAESGIIGVIAEMHTPFVGDLVTSIAGAVRASGRDMLVYSLPAPNRDMPGNVLDLLLQAVDGVIAVLPYDTTHLSSLSRAHVPVVSVDRRGDTPSFPSVSADSYAGTRMAVGHLVDLGHRRIAHIGGDGRLFSARERERAYRDALCEAGLPFEPRYVASGAYLREGGRGAADALLALTDPPTAIVAANDLSASGAMEAVRARGLGVPSDVSIIGFDDIPLANQLRPALTTIRQPLSDLGGAAVELLLRVRQRDEPVDDATTLPVELIIRDSTAPCRSAPDP